MTDDQDNEQLARARAAVRRDDDREITAAAQRVEQRLSAWVQAEAADRTRVPHESPAPTRTRPHAPAWRSWALRGFGLAAAATVAFVAWRHTPAPSVSPRTDARTYATATGQQAVVTLDDGTSVTLAPQSTLRITRFDTHGRSVDLTGEAYFDVAHVDGAPFVVRTGVVETRVLGTTFFVRRYPQDRAAQVTVTTGKVAVSTRGHQPAVTLTAGDIAAATDSSVVARNDPDAVRETGWLDGRLVFHDAPTPDVLQALHRWYGYEFRFADTTLAQRSLTVVISTRSSAEALGTLKTYLNVDLRFDGQVVTLVPRQTPRPSRTLPTTHTSPMEVGR
jgi:ferric-dicitrate binding protein FerR (iron transport regulator)